ncbi:hypothetical protein ACHAXT_005101 [Thalassiosira profunda]
MARPGPLRRRHPAAATSALLLLLAAFSLDSASAFSAQAHMSSSSPKSKQPLRMSASQLPQHQYPRPLHPGGLTLPPLVEDRLPIVAASGKDGIAIQTDLLLVRPPDMAGLWEWMAYSKQRSDGDPSWGRVWPTALALARLVVRAMNDGDEGGTEPMKQASKALRSASHAVELGCGLGVAGLAYASAAAAIDDKRRTITFLDREPYALHCAISSAATNGIATGPIGQVDDSGNDAPITARAAMDDWTLPTSNDQSDATDKESNSPVKNMSHRDLHLPTYDDTNTVLLASDILYEPDGMTSLASKLQSLLHPLNGGYALIADPEKERTAGCREAFVAGVEGLGGEVTIIPLPGLDTNGANGAGGKGGTVLLEGDVDIDGSLAKTVLIVVRFGGSNTAS